MFETEKTLIVFWCPRMISVCEDWREKKNPYNSKNEYGIRTFQWWDSQMFSDCVNPSGRIKKHTKEVLIIIYFTWYKMGSCSGESTPNEPLASTDLSSGPIASCRPERSESVGLHQLHNANVTRPTALFWFSGIPTLYPSLYRRVLLAALDVRRQRFSDQPACCLGTSASFAEQKKIRLSSVQSSQFTLNSLEPEGLYMTPA